MKTKNPNFEFYIYLKDFKVLHYYSDHPLIWNSDFVININFEDKFVYNLVETINRKIFQDILKLHVKLKILIFGFHSCIAGTIYYVGGRL